MKVFILTSVIVSSFLSPPSPLVEPGLKISVPIQHVRWPYPFALCLSLPYCILI